jgi:hypothetical protein
MVVPTGPKALEEALDRLSFAAQTGDEDGVVTARAAIGISFRRLVQEITYLNELLDHQPKKEVVH